MKIDNRITWLEWEIKYLCDNYKKIRNKEIAQFLNKKTKAVKDKAWALKITSFYSYDKNFFKTITPLSSYWAGFIAADGCLLHREGSNIYGLVIELSVLDKNHLLRFMDDIKYTGKIYDHLSKSPSSKNVTVLSKLYISVSKEFFEDLRINFNLTPRKTYRLAPPLNLDEENLLAYLIGYIDGDGSICLTNRKFKEIIKPELMIGFSSSSLALISWIREFTNIRFNRSLRKKINNVNNIPGSSGNQFSISGLRACHMVDFLNKIDLPKLARKWNQPKVLEFISQKKREFPHLFIK